jgi:hypothetical protein
VTNGEAFDRVIEIAEGEGRYNLALALRMLATDLGFSEQSIEDAIFESQEDAAYDG